MTTEPTKTVPAVENAAKILRYLVERGQPDGVAGTARATGVTVSSAFNILKTLANEDFVSFDPLTKTYAPGMGLLGLAAGLIGRPALSLVQPALAEMADRHKVMVALWQITPNERLILQGSSAPDSTIHVNMRLGTRLPAHIGAVGRCYAAATGIARADLKRKFDQLRWQNSPGFEVYWAEVEAARARGYGLDMGNLYKGVSIVAAVCCDSSGRPQLGVSSINIAGQVAVSDLEDLGRSLKDLARRIEVNVLQSQRP